MEGDCGCGSFPSPGCLRCRDCMVGRQSCLGRLLSIMVMVRKAIGQGSGGYGRFGKRTRQPKMDILSQLNSGTPMKGQSGVYSIEFSESEPEEKVAEKFRNVKTWP